MNNGASSSKPPAAAQSSSSSSLLAPGFRFHPTDEELVSYYLKRRVSGRPIRVEAIAEVDLYKAEPWDLPAMSRLRSRDMEWYFFSPLDRKYANRSRTNRATAQGYWKTTGKDRPVRHGPRTVGMKKTLVFHAGRAPRGERTNWVMHEYRLEDEELARAGIPQDAFVVCRIFQKSGTGPQNGAQYGAPFVEEEWEEADGMPLAVVDGHDSGHDSGDAADANNLPRATVRLGTQAVTGAGDEGFLQLADFENNQDQGNQQENAGLLAASSDGQISSSYSDDPIFLVKEIFQGQRSIDNMKATGPQDSQHFHNDVEGNVVFAGWPQNSPIDYDGFLELNDVVDMDNVEYLSSEDSVGSLLGASNGQMSVNREDDRKSSPEILGMDKSVNSLNENNISHEIFQIPTQDDLFVELNDLLNPMTNDHSLEVNDVFYDASSDPQFAQEDFVEMQDLYSPMGDSNGLNMMDDILAYFDCTNNNLHYSTLGSSEKLCMTSSNESTAEVDGSSVPTYNTHLQASVANVGASSLGLPQADNLPMNMNAHVTEAPDFQRNDGRGKTFPKRLANMLGSFSAPPAYASESPTSPVKSFGQKSFGHTSGASSTSSIQVATGVIQIHGFNMTSRAEHWSLDKNGDMGFLLSFGFARNVLGKPEGSEPMPKMQGWVMSVVLRGGFYLFLLSALFLALSVKVGMRVCYR